MCVELVTVEGWWAAGRFKQRELQWAGFVSALRALRFPPVLTWLRLYNGPERVTRTHSRLFSFPFTPFSFFSLLLEGWGGGPSYCGTFVRQPVAEAGPAGDLWQHLQDAKPLYMRWIIRRALAEGIGRRCSDGCMESVLESRWRQLMLYDRGISQPSWSRLHLVFAPS